MAVATDRHQRHREFSWTSPIARDLRVTRQQRDLSSFLRFSWNLKL